MKPKHIFEFLLVWVVDRFFCLLPERAARAVGVGLGKLASRVLAKRDVLVKENLKKAFPEKTAEEIEKIAAGVWENIGRTAVEFIRLPKVKGREALLFTYQNTHFLDEAIKENKGIIFVTFHFSNWEMAGVMHQTRYKNTVAIARPMKNPLVENWVQSKRRFCGMNIILHRQAVRQSLKVLRQKKNIAILADQNLYHGGVFAPFFGRPAATTTLPALLHLRTRAPIVLVYSKRTGNGATLTYLPPLRFPDLEFNDESVLAITTRINSELEKIVSADPNLWFWVHNRWKREGEVGAQVVSSQEAKNA